MDRPQVFVTIETLSPYGSSNGGQYSSVESVATGGYNGGHGSLLSIDGGDMVTPPLVEEAQRALVSSQDIRFGAVQS